MNINYHFNAFSLMGLPHKIVQHNFHYIGEVAFVAVAYEQVVFGGSAVAVWKIKSLK